MNLGWKVAVGRSRCDIPAIAFGTAVVMWAAGYVLRMSPTLVPAWFLLTLLVAIQIAGGIAVGRWTNRRLGSAAATGLLTGCINLLVLASVLSEDHSGTDQIVGVIGFVGVTVLLTLVGFFIGIAMTPGGMKAAATNAIPGDDVGVDAPPPAGISAPEDDDEMDDVLGAGGIRRDAINWLGWFTKIAVLGTFVLIIAGGLVTGHEAGLAVVDWPNTEGQLMFLYPLSKMTGGVYYEHAHRLYGALVGITTIAVAIAIWRHRRVAGAACTGCGYLLVGLNEWRCPECGRPFTPDEAGAKSLDEVRDGLPRWTPLPRWLRMLALIAVGLVIAQGVMGGLRVTGHLTLSTDPSRTSPQVVLAIVHGVTAQVFFALMVSIAAFTSATWWDRQNVLVHRGASADRTLTAILLGLLFLQLTLGATFRHLNGHADLPGGMVLGILHTHIVVAAGVLTVILIAGIRGLSMYRDQPRVRKSANSLMHAVGAQIALGILSMIAVLMRDVGGSEPIPWWEVLVTTMHQAFGAILLALATLHAIWVRRLLA